jgi:hypothetical protein
MRSLLLAESLDLRPSNQYFLVESKLFTFSKNVCVPFKAAVEMKSKIFYMVLSSLLFSFLFSSLFAHHLYGPVGTFRVS